jgi:HAD superfamily hydrolase (TIGR01490 family)
MEILRGGRGGAWPEDSGEENRMNQREKSGRVAAFFDLDGTLIAEPSVERRFFASLRERRAIRMGNYFLWLARAVWLAPRGIATVWHANKMYLRGGCACEGGQPEMAVPRFFPGGVDQMAWHTRQGHAIVLVSGTLAPLAQEMALALTVRLAVRGIAASVGVCATQPEETDGRWTGRIVGEAMFDEAKGRAVRRLAAEEGFALERCYAYGDSAGDRAMLEAVGRPCVVNPSEEMGRLARRREWAVLAWTEQPRAGEGGGTAQTRDEALWVRWTAWLAPVGKAIKRAN